LLLAVLENRVGIPLGHLDVFVSAVGGARLGEPGTDLGVCLAVASSLVGRPLPDGLVACGEVGLGGELRQVARTPRRLSEAARLGFTEAVVPASATTDVAGMRIHRVPTLRDACETLGLLRAGPNRVAAGHRPHHRAGERPSHAGPGGDDLDAAAW
jgi:DNA repair protein RadA/Sms